VHRQGDATVRVLVGEGSPVRLGTPALILDVELPDGGELDPPVPPEFQGFAYLLDGEAVFGANRRRARPSQLVLLGPGEELTVTDAAPRHAVPAHGGQALPGGPAVQRAVCGRELLDPAPPAGAGPAAGRSGGEPLQEPTPEA
jgi:Pirin C-terminal cupin domain